MTMPVEEQRRRGGAARATLMPPLPRTRPCLVPVRATWLGRLSSAELAASVAEGRIAAARQRAFLAGFFLPA
jgi:hypothetical protein